MNNTLKSSLFGLHVSIAGGFHKAIEHGQSFGCTAIQIFTSSSRQWSSRTLDLDTVTRFHDLQKQSNIQVIVAHASYLINIGSSKDDVYQKSLAALTQELSICEALHIPYLVLHPGSFVGGDKEKSRQKVIDSINKVLQVTKKTHIVLETMAGQGSTLCSTFEEIKYILDRVEKKDQIGVCVDTCHIFVAGYDIRTEEKYLDTWNVFHNIIGISHLKVIHVNDSKTILGSKIDRHEHLGKGAIGAPSFELLFTDKRFIHIPKILETPKKEPNDDQKNIDFVKRIIKR